MMAMALRCPGSVSSDLTRVVAAVESLRTVYGRPVSPQPSETMKLVERVELSAKDLLILTVQTEHITCP